MPEAGSKPRTPLLLSAALYSVLAAASIVSNGWRHTAWMGWVLMAVGSMLTERLPEPVRRSFRQSWRNPSSIVASTVLILGVILIGFPIFQKMRPARAPELDARGLQIAEEAVGRFHARVSQGRYAEACRAADPTAFAGITRVSCSEFLAYLHERLGKVTDTRREHSYAARDRSSAVAVTAGLDHTTHWERGESQEHFEWRISQPEAVLVSYTISSDTLAMGSGRSTAPGRSSSD